MPSALRPALAWLHTWFGLGLGYVLMVCFFFGSLSVFDREIDRWALPETRFARQPMPSFDRALAPVFAQMTPDADELEAARRRNGGPLPEVLPARAWAAYTTHRDPVLRLFAEFGVADPPRDADEHVHVHGEITLDPRTARVLPHDPLKVGSEFFYPMHIGLHLTWHDLGYWIVGLAALSMLAALVSGVVLHRKVFREFFTFRPDRHRLRSTLDLHNLTGVVALPFHFFFAFTGLLIFAGMYFPVSESVLKPAAQAAALAEAKAKGLAFAPAGVAAKLASVDAMVVEARRRWAARGMPGEVGYLTVTHPGDRNSCVTVYRAGSDRVAPVGQPVYFDGPTGKVIFEEAPAGAVQGLNDFLSGLHLQQFEHWALRWFYLFGGLAGTVCIATGFVFFVEKRKRRHAARGQSGSRWADALAVTTVTGMLIATAAILVANRALPPDLADRGGWQQRVFWAAWLLAFAHAVWRTAPVARARLAPAWAEQCLAVSVLAVAAVGLNWVTTGDHLLKTVSEGDWPVAGVDAALLASAVLAGVAAARLRRRERAGPAQPPAPVGNAEPAGV